MLIFSYGTHRFHKGALLVHLYSAAPLYFLKFYSIFWAYIHQAVRQISLNLEAAR